MALIINIETSTKACSVALSDNGVLKDHLEHKTDEFMHAEWLHPAIQRLLDRNQLDVKDLRAVAISQGPGSYTGLRIGVSAAKGFAYATNIPLIGVDTLQLLAFQARLKMPEEKRFVPMIDARRMEVFTATFDDGLHCIVPAHPLILDEHSFNGEAGNTLVLCGDGAHKAMQLNIVSPRLIDAEVSSPLAQHMCALSYNKFIRKEFENVAYFEPFYLKEFQIKSKS